MLIQDRYLQTMKFTAQRTSLGHSSYTSPSWRYRGLVLILGKKELLTWFAAERIKFSC